MSVEYKNISAFTVETNVFVGCVCMQKTSTMSTVFANIFFLPQACDFVYCANLPATNATTGRCSPGQTVLVLNEASFVNWTMGVWYTAMGAVFIACNVTCQFALINRQFWAISCYRL